MDKHSAKPFWGVPIPYHPMRSVCLLQTQCKLGANGDAQTDERNTLFILRYKMQLGMFRYILISKMYELGCNKKFQIYGVY